MRSPVACFGSRKQSVKVAADNQGKRYAMLSDHVEAKILEGLSLRWNLESKHA